MEYTVKLCRDSLESPWGFRLQGGADLKSHLSVQRVFPGSPAEGELQKGDIIIGIDKREAKLLSHSSAENLIRSAGGEIVLRIKRFLGNNPNQSTKLGEEANNKSSDMWNQGQGSPYGTDYYSQTPGRNQATHDKAMLNRVSQSLGNKLLHQQSYVMPAKAPGYFHDEPNNQQHYGWVPVQTDGNSYGGPAPRKFYQPQNFNRPTPGPLAYKPSNNPYSTTAHAAHLQYNSPLGLYSLKNAQNALNAAVPADSSAGQTIKQQIISRAAEKAAEKAADKPRLSAYQGGEAKRDIVDSPTLRYVLREDQVKAKTGHTPGMKFYKEVHEYGPGKVPLVAYKEEVDETVRTSDF